MRGSSINCLPNDKVLDWSKFTAFAGDMFNVTSKIISVFHRIENIEG